MRKIADIGPNQQAVVDVLDARPASCIARQENHVQHTFAALFNGAQSPGWIEFGPHGARVGGGRPFFNKSEAEWHWPSDWDLLVKIGLITYRTEIKPYPEGMGHRTMIHWQVTPKGWNVRLDDLAWFMELRAAREADEATKQ
jgi:hypothetical protein